ncbi:hypothetical protein [Dickeya ananatis]
MSNISADDTMCASRTRHRHMLYSALGPLIAAALDDPDVVEIMLNPDCTLWVDRLSTGLAPLEGGDVCCRGGTHHPTGGGPCRYRGASPPAAADGGIAGDR